MKGKTLGKTATGKQRIKGHRRSVESFGQRTLESMLGSVTTLGDLLPTAAVSKSKDLREHLKDESPSKSVLHPRNKDPVKYRKSASVSMKVKDKLPKASTKPCQRMKGAKPKVPGIKRERVGPRPPHGSPSKPSKGVVDLTQSPITKYLSPTKRHPDQPEMEPKRSPHTNGFVSITDATTRHLCVRSLSSFIDLTVNVDSSPIDLCSTSSSSFSSRTSTPKSSGLTSPWERFSISTSPSARNSSAGDAKLDLHESEDFIPLDVSMDTTVGSLCRAAGGETNPVQLHECASKVLPMLLELDVEVDDTAVNEMDDAAVNEMDEPVDNLDALRRELELEFGQWNSSPEEDLRELAVQRMVRMDSVPSPTHVAVVPLSGCHVMEYLETSLPFRVSLALEEVLLLLSPSSRMPSAQLMAVVCEKVILAEESTWSQRGTGYNFLSQVLNQFPPRRSEVVRQVYVGAFERLGWLPRCRNILGGRMRALVPMMTPSSHSLLVLRWMNNVLLSDLLSCTHSASLAPPMVNGLSAGLRHVLKAAAHATGSGDERCTVAESLLEECLVTVQLYATHLLIKRESIDSLAKEFSVELVAAGISHSSPTLNSVYPLQLRNTIMKKLKQLH